MRTYLLILSSLLMVCCGNQQVRQSTEKAIITAVNDTNAKPLAIATSKIDSPDSTWIKVLNKITLPQSIHSNNLINVYYKYDTIINGYEVTARWMPFDPHSETGYVVMNFHHINNGQSFQYINSKKYNNYNLDAITFSEDFKGYHNGDIYHFDYLDTQNAQFEDSPISYYAPFQFYDVDFDGEKELLINDWSKGKQGNTYTPFDIQNNALKRIESIPLENICNTMKFDRKKKQIVYYNYDGCCYGCVAFFSKHSVTITDTTIPSTLQGYAGEWILDKYYKQTNSDFRLDSIYQSFNDTLGIYKMSADGIENSLKRKKKGSDII